MLGPKVSCGDPGGGVPCTVCAGDIGSGDAPGSDSESELGGDAGSAMTPERLGRRGKMGGRDGVRLGDGGEGGVEDMAGDRCRVAGVVDGIDECPTFKGLVEGRREDGGGGGEGGELKERVCVLVQRAA